MSKKSFRPRRAWKSKRRTGYKSKLAKSEFASMKETFEFATLDVGTSYRDFTMSLARCTRASQIARGYQEYRITKLEYLFKPLLDTFAPAGAGGTGIPVPYLYYLIDKVGANGSIQTQEQYDRAGAKPRRLDDKSLRIAYKPGVLSFGYDEVQGTNSYSKPLISPWLACNGKNTNTTTGSWQASSIDHLGMEWLVSGSSDVKYQVLVTAHFQFRKPAVEITLSEGLPSIVEAFTGKEIGLPQPPPAPVV